MSRGSAWVIFEDGTKLYTLYNGTVDILWSTLVDSLDEAWGSLWREYRRGNMAALKSECNCGQLEPVTVVHEHGGGDSWEGEACKQCKAYSGPINGIDARLSHDES